MPANHVLLRRTTLTVNTASVTLDLTGVSGYTDLLIKFSIRQDNNSNNYLSAFVTFNGSSTGYSQRMLYGTGSSALSASGSGSYLDWSAYGAAGTATASTFGNGEMYIPNYAGSAQKSVSSDSVSENNATGAIAALTAGLWANTAPITSITFAGNSGNFVAGSSFAVYGIANPVAIPAAAPKADGGDIINTDGTYWYHIFTGAGIFKPQLNLTCEYVVIGGGGGGGGASQYTGAAGGAGGGGYRSSVVGELSGGGASAESRLNLLSNTGYAVTVGAGGTGGAGTNANAPGNGTQGSSSTFATITSIGGGFGGASRPYGGAGAGQAGGSGGSGGGGGYSDPGYAAPAGGTGTTGQGYNGGAGTNTGAPYGGSGGAGAGAATNNTQGGAGGVGVASSITGTSVFRAGGGGGGGAQSSGLNGGAGGNGGGGAGGKNNSGLAGTANTGGGGGAGGEGNIGGLGGNGGSGVVIIRYPVA